MKAGSSRQAKRDSDIASMHSLVKLLREVESAPGLFIEDPSLRSALRSQGALAKHGISDRSIVAMSLTHQRLIANLSVGFDELDRRRRAALKAIDREVSVRQKHGASRRKKGLEMKIGELEAHLMTLKLDLALLQRAFDIRSHQARHYASLAGADIIALCKKEQRELDATFSLRRTAIDHENVVPFRPGRKP